MTGKDMIKTANLIKNASNLSKAGVQEELIVKTKDILDPNRGCLLYTSPSPRDP